MPLTIIWIMVGFLFLKKMVSEEQMYKIRCSKSLIYCKGWSGRYCRAMATFHWLPSVIHLGYYGGNPGGGGGVLDEVFYGSLHPKVQTPCHPCPLI